LFVVNVDGRVSRECPIVLLVDDHEDSAAMYAIGLLAMGFQAVTARSAEDGFERACRLKPDVVVADVSLGVVVKTAIPLSLAAEPLLR
jgi:CheY-like chemotaxis protein